MYKKNVSERKKLINIETNKVRKNIFIYRLQIQILHSRSLFN